MVTEVRTGGDRGTNEGQPRDKAVDDLGDERVDYLRISAPNVEHMRSRSACESSWNSTSRHVAEYGKQRRQVSVCGWQTKVAPFYATEKERRFSGFTPRPRQAFRSADQPRSAIVRNRAPSSAAARPLACPPGRAHACDARAVAELREVRVHVSRPDARVRWPSCARPANVGGDSAPCGLERLLPGATRPCSGPPY